jgi:hypothetical protein
MMGLATSSKHVRKESMVKVYGEATGGIVDL